MKAKELRKEMFDQKLQRCLDEIKYEAACGRYKKEVKTEIYQSTRYSIGIPKYMTTTHSLRDYEDLKIQDELRKMGYEVDVSYGTRTIDNQREIEIEPSSTKSLLARIFGKSDPSTVTKYFQETFDIKTITISWEPEC